MVLRNDKSDIPVERHDQHIISCSHPGYLECRFGPNTFHESKSWRLSMRDLSFIDPALLTFHTSTCSISSMYRSEGGEMACQIVSCAGRILQEFATCSMSSWRIIDTSKWSIFSSSFMAPWPVCATSYQIVNRYIDCDKDRPLILFQTYLLLLGCQLLGRSWSRQPCTCWESGMTTCQCRRRSVPEESFHPIQNSADLSCDLRDRQVILQSISACTRKTVSWQTLWLWMNQRAGIRNRSSDTAMNVMHGELRPSGRQRSGILPLILRDLFYNTPGVP